MKETLRSKCIDVVRPYLDEDGNVGRGDFPRVRDALHTDIVAEAVSRLSTSRVLHAAPPAIDRNESTLPRLVRSTLSQLRLGFCPLMMYAQIAA